MIANWPAPHNISALTSTSKGGQSVGNFTSNNLGLHVGDDGPVVLANRKQLADSLGLNNELIWLEQVHSTCCVVVEEDDNRVADAAITRSPNYSLAIMTADCLPIVLCNKAGTEIAAIHCGWRGLVNGIIENTLAKMQSKGEQLMAWLGPAICPKCFEIGEEVKQQYLSRYPFTAPSFIEQGAQLFADLPGMAELILNSLGVVDVYQSGACTYESKNQFYSYRREAKTGRMATLIWFK